MLPCCSTLEHAAQELVINGGFERYRNCPKGLAEKPVRQLHRIRPVQGTPGYFHACSNAQGVPGNWAGHQSAAEGEGYIGLVLTAHGGGECSVREFVQLELARPLVNGGRYRLSFLVSLADRSGYSTDRIGACFSTNDRSRKGIAGLLGRPAIENTPDRFLEDTMGWMRVEGIYNAKGGERYLLLGNFHTCGHSSRKAITTNTGEGVLQNTKTRGALDLDTDKRRALRRRMLATQAYVYVDAVSLTPTEGPEAPAILTREEACPDNSGTAPDTNELLPDPRFAQNLPAHRARWQNASGGTPDLMRGMAGIYLHSAVDRDHREYLRTELRERLDPCGIYRFRVALRRDVSYGYAVDRIGLVLVDNFTQDRRRGLLPGTPSWSSPAGSVIDPDGKGITLCGEFQAPGCSRTLLLGNFSSDTATVVLHTAPRGGPFAYYFVEEVSLWRIGTASGCLLECPATLPVADGPSTTGADTLFTERLLVHFAVADAIPEGSLDDLSVQLLRVLALRPLLRFRIVGHTDDTGSPMANDRLSRRRAETVRAALVDLGLPTSSLITGHHGSSVPIAGNDTEAGRSMNRRVEILLLDAVP